MFYGVDIGGTKTEIVALIRKCKFAGVSASPRQCRIMNSFFRPLLHLLIPPTGRLERKEKLASACPVLWTDIPENYCHLTCLASQDAGDERSGPPPQSFG